MQEQKLDKAYALGVKYLSKVPKRLVSSKFLRFLATIFQISHEIKNFCQIGNLLVKRKEKKEEHFVNAIAAHYLMKNYEEVVYYSEEMKAYWEPSYLGVYLTAISHYEQGKLQKALEMLDSSIDLEPRWKVSRLHYIILTISQIPSISCEEFVAEILEEIRSHLNILSQQIEKEEGQNSGEIR